MRRFLLLALALLALPAATAAQVVVVTPGTPTGPLRSNPTGLMIGAYLNGSAIQFDDVDFADDIESGGGFGLKLGWGFSHRFIAFLALNGASIAPEEGDNYALAHLDLGARVGLGSRTSAFNPYLQAALTGRAASIDFEGSDLTISGGALSAGGGLQYFFSPSLAIDTNLMFSFGDFTEAEFEGDTEDLELGATSTRFDLGLAWYPLGRS